MMTKAEFESMIVAGFADFIFLIEPENCDQLSEEDMKAWNIALAIDKKRRNMPLKDFVSSEAGTCQRWIMLIKGYGSLKPVSQSHKMLWLSPTKFVFSGNKPLPCYFQGGLKVMEKRKC